MRRLLVVYCLALLVAVPSIRGGERVDSTAYIDGRIASKGPNLARTLFASGNFNTGEGYVRNPDLWCADLDLTCFSPWNSTEHNLQGGTLITRRHVLLANHFSNPYTGTPPMIPGITAIKFVARDNTLYTRTISRLTPVKGTDLLIGTLDRDLPDKITPAPLFPFDRGAVVPPGTPVIYTDQEKWACVGECVIGAGKFFTLRPATLAGRSTLTTPGPARVGDSGSPVFLPLHGRAVLLGHFFFANGGPRHRELHGRDQCDHRARLSRDRSRGGLTGQKVPGSDFCRPDRHRCPGRGDDPRLDIFVSALPG